MPPQFRLNYKEMEQAQPELPGRFGLLSLFPRDYSFTWNEACALWATPTAGPALLRRSLDLLRQWQLVERVPGTDRIYRMPRVVYQLAEEYVTGHPEMRVLGEQRLIDYYAAFTAANNGDQPEQLSRIADVYEAANNALNWAERTARWDDVVVLARALCRFFYVRQMSNQYRAGLRRGLTAAQRSGRPRDGAWFLREQAGVVAASGRFPQAVPLFERSIAIYRELGDERGEAQVLYEWGQAESAQGHYETARHLINESMDIMRELHHGILQPATLHELADLSIKQGLYEQAQRELDEALNAEIDRGDVVAQARTLHKLGDLTADRGQANEATDYYLRSLALARQLEDRHQGGRTLAALGLLAAMGNEANTATRCWLAALALFRSVGADEAADMDRALDRHLGAGRAFLLAETTRLALAEWWNV